MGLRLNEAGRAKRARHARTNGTRRRLPHAELPCNPVYRNIDAAVYLSHSVLLSTQDFATSLAGSRGTPKVLPIYSAPWWRRRLATRLVGRERRSAAAGG